MRRYGLLPLALLAYVGLGGCQSLLTDLQGCERHYDGTVAGGTLTPAVLAGKAQIDCCPVGTYSNTAHTNCLPIKP